jgi:hypothetical protein
MGTTTGFGAMTPRTRNLPDIARHFESASADMLGAILAQSMDCIKVISPTGQLDFMNRNGRCAMEIEDFSLVAGRNWEELWPEEFRPVIRDAVDRAARGKATGSRRSARPPRAIRAGGRCRCPRCGMRLPPCRASSPCRGTSRNG